MMSMTFEASSSVTLLFDFWNVRGPLGMVMTVFVVLMLTVFYEVLKVFRVKLGSGSNPAQAYTAPLSCSTNSNSIMDRCPSESSVTTTESQPPAPNNRNSWQLHIFQTGLHVLQVFLGYMLMLCVMTYNVWIFLGVILGSVLGYFISYPLLGPT